MEDTPKCTQTVWEEEEEDKTQRTLDISKAMDIHKSSDVL